MTEGPQDNAGCAIMLAAIIAWGVIAYITLLILRAIGIAS